MPKGTNGSAKRRLGSWIDRFIASTAALESPAIFRKWVAITTIAAALEQKVWIITTAPMYPNLYTFIIAPPGGGKSRAIDLARDLLVTLPDPYIAPTSINAASIIDHMLECKRIIINLPNPPLEYNSMAILVGEFGTFMSQYEDDLMAILTDFYNVRPYGQRRRGNQLKINIERPQLSMLIGSTPANLMKFMPENAWGQGFASRIVFVYSEDKEMVDDFAPKPEGKVELDPDLVHDLGLINTLVGQFGVSEEYQKLVLLWRESDEQTPSAPRPTHPRLQHYNSRRKEILYRLSMVSSVDRSDALVLTREDFNTALGWMVEAEAAMPKIFEEHSSSGDGIVMDEALHLVQSRGSLPEAALIRFIRQRVAAHAVMRIIEIMERGGMIKVKSTDRYGSKTYAAGPALE